MDEYNLFTMIIVGGMIVLPVFMRSYLVWGISLVGLFALNGYYNGGFFTVLSILVLLSITHRFIYKQRKYAKNQRMIYKEGRATAAWSKVFDKGFNDEYFK